MFLCSICRFECEEDDRAVPPAGRLHGTCLRCYLKEAGKDQPMPKKLQREVADALAALT